MREILFRGQTRRFGEKVRMDGKPLESNWVYGGLFQGPNKSVIYGYDPVEKHVVYSDTVGQYTGLTDRNGKKIFEGDVIRWGCRYDYDCYEESLQHPEEYEGCDPGQDLGIGVVKWFGDEGYPAFDIAPNEFESNGLSYLSEDCDFVIEVIGNIHDNPELLKERNNA